jgi:hypothetical protein
MPSNINLQIGQVIRTIDPTQFDQFTDTRDKELLPGTIRVRLRSLTTAPPIEVTAVPANASHLHVPLYGEQVIVFNAISGQTENTKTSQYYYMPAVSVHGQVNNNIMPFLQDTRIETKNYQSSGITTKSKNKPPEQLSFESRAISTIQPYQGDSIIQDRFGSALRFSSTHIELSPYLQKPFWQGSTVGDPFVSLTCGIDGVKRNNYFTIENPDKDSSLLYLSSTQKINNLKL